MPKPLVVVDSEAKARAIQAQMDGDLETLLITAPPVKVASLPPRDALKKEALKFSFAPLPSEKRVIDTLRQYLASDIYLALDSDQRGEYWSWAVNGYLLSTTNGMKTARRLQLLGLSREELQESFRLVEPVQGDKAKAYYVRMLFNSYLTRHLQRLLGTTTGPQGLPLHINSLTALFLLAEREAEIKAFAPSLKWQVRVRLATAGGEVETRLEEAYGITDDGFVRNAEEAREAVGLFRDKPFQVNEIDRTEFVIQPPAPYRMVDLLEDAFVLHHLSPGEVLDAVLKLFQGVEVDGVPSGLISTYLPLEHAEPQKILARVREQVAGIFQEQALGKGKDQELASGMILPTRPEIEADDLGGVLSESERTIYRLIRDRALASHMKEAAGEVVDAGFMAGGKCFFRASMRAVTDKGFLAAYQGYQHRELLDPCPLAGVEQGQQVENLQIIPEQTCGFPPEYYTFEGLAADLADFSMTLDAATIVMLQNMMDGGYLAIMPDGSLRCRENTKKLLNVMNKAFPSMIGINLSAYFEQTVSEVVSGRKPLAFALKQFDQTLMMQGNVLVKVSIPVAPRPRARTSRSIIKAPTPLTEAPEAEGKPPAFEAPGTQEEEPVESAAPVEEPVPEVSAAETAEPTALEEAPPAEEEAPAEEVAEEETGEEVGEELVLEPESVALAQSAEQEEAVRQVFDEAGAEEEAAPKEVSAAAQAVPPASAAGVGPGPTKACPDCGRPLLLKEDRFGKYWFCSGHPECRHSESYEEETGLGMSCPLCAIGHVITKHTPTGKLFYVCPEQDCEFMAWSKPYPLSCQVCDSPFLVEKKTLAGKRYLRCPRAGCTYMQPLPGDADVEGLPALSGPRKKKVRVRRVAKAGGGGGKRKVRVVRRKR